MLVCHPAHNVKGPPSGGRTLRPDRPEVMKPFGKVTKSSESALDQGMATSYILGPFRLDPEAEMLFRGDERVALSQRAVTLLRVLVERPGMPVSKDTLIETAWAGLAVEDSNLTVQIAALRRVFA